MGREFYEMLTDVRGLIKDLEDKVISEKQPGPFRCPPVFKEAERLLETLLGPSSWPTLEVTYLLLAAVG